MNLSVVIPSYKQAPVICAQLHAIDSYLKTLNCTYEIILVIDGDVDQTCKKVSRLNIPSLTIHCLERNYGKGIALKEGFFKAQGELIAYIDAGSDIDHTYLKAMIDTIHQSDADIVIGSKRHPLSRISYPNIRRVYSEVYQIMNTILFSLDVQDTQVGMKLMRRRVLQQILPYLTIKQFACDLEMLVLASRLGYTRIIEAPVRIDHTFRSTINIRAVTKMLWDTLTIFYRVRVLHDQNIKHITYAKKQKLAQHRV